MVGQCRLVGLAERSTGAKKATANCTIIIVNCLYVDIVVRQLTSKLLHYISLLFGW